MLAAKLAVEDLVEELIAAQADVGARDKWGTDLGRLVCYREVEQMGCEIKCKKKEQRGDWRLGDSLPPCCQGGKSPCANRMEHVSSPIILNNTNCLSPV